MRIRGAYLVFILLAAFLVTSASASYTVTNLNTTVVLYRNTTATVTEIFNVSVSNSSVSQYVGSRASINLTLSKWQEIIGPSLVEHILNAKSAASNFRLLPGPLIRTSNGGHAQIVINYQLLNITSIKRAGPRLLQYSFNPNVFNFEHGQSGEILPQNTSLSIVLPAGSQLESIYPVPDSPLISFSSGNQFVNVTKLTWDTGEPLSKFDLKFQVTETLGEEVQSFFLGLYSTLGVFLYVIIVIVVLLLITYVYMRANWNER